MNGLSGAELGLGTAQLGSDYGLANIGAGANEAAAEALLRTAADAGVTYLDTAPGYGVSEDLIGRLRPTGWPLRIVTKTPVFAGERLTREDGQALIESAKRSCERLRIDSLHGLLVHHGTNLLKPGYAHLVDALHEVKQRSLATKVGYSAYTPEDAAAINERFAPDIVQLPLNLLDQRFIAAKTLAAFKCMGTEVHVRSAMLQGLLAMAPADLPSYFAAVRDHLVRLHRWLEERSISVTEACLAFTLQQPEVAAVIVGSDTAAQFAQTRSAAANEAARALDYGQWAISDTAILDPSRWPPKDALTVAISEPNRKVQ